MQRFDASGHYISQESLVIKVFFVNTLECHNGYVIIPPLAGRIMKRGKLQRKKPMNAHPLM